MITAPTSTAPALAPPAGGSRWSITDLFTGTRLVQRLGASFAAPLVLMLGAALVTGLQLKRIDAANAQMDSDRKRMAVVSEWMGSVRGNLDRAVLATRLDAAIADDEPTRQRLLAPVGRLNEAMAAEASAAAKAQQQMNDSAAPGEDDIRALVADVGKHRERFVATRAKIRDDLLLGEGAPRIDAELLPLAKAMEKSLDTLQHVMARRSDTATSALAAHVSHAQWVLLASCLLAVFTGALLAWRIAHSLSRSIVDASAMARAIAGGDLSGRLEVRGRDEVAGLQQALVSMQASLSQMVEQVRSSADSIRVASVEVANGNLDLSQRTEQAASNLQQTASAMAELTGTVHQSSEAAAQANQLASSASSVARRGGEVVAQVVNTMEQINNASRKIADIIGTIDGIAFQTNILALNAAVEAARAGEQGRGFAVVASEVRSLAQRSAEAAKQIKALIGASVEKVDSGSRLVADAGSTMTEIVASVQRVSDIIGEISATSAEQSGGIGAINGAVKSLDQMTQQNAALVEESAAAAESLKEQAARLGEVVAYFQTDGNGHLGGPANHEGSRSNGPSSSLSSSPSSSATGTAPRQAPATPARAAKAALAQAKAGTGAAPVRAAAQPAVTAAAAGSAAAPLPREPAGAHADKDWETF